MSKEVDLKIAQFKGYVRADQITAENIDSWAESLNGTVSEGEISFQIHKWTHHAGIGDWVVLFLPRGDVQVYSDSMFHRILEIPEEV